MTDEDLFPEDECHDADCERKRRYTIHMERLDVLHDAQTPDSMPPGFTSYVARACDEHFREKLHKFAREERRSNRELMRIRYVNRYVDCPVYSCTEQVREECIDYHIEHSHGGRTYTDRAREKLQKIRDNMRKNFA